MVSFGQIDFSDLLHIAFILFPIFAILGVTGICIYGLLFVLELIVKSPDDSDHNLEIESVCMVRYTNRQVLMQKQKRKNSDLFRENVWDENEKPKNRPMINQEGEIVGGIDVPEPDKNDPNALTVLDVVKLIAGGLCVIIVLGFLIFGAAWLWHLGSSIGLAPSDNSDHVNCSLVANQAKPICVTAGQGTITSPTDLIGYASALFNTLFPAFGAILGIALGLSIIGYIIKWIQRAL